jgi:EAL domain-containing protein (putative c-di-GMP-specific phosphodiesterase class I)
LVRWLPLGQQRIIPPNDFIPVAEETGLILPLGKWVLEEACRQLRKWQDRFPSNPPLTMSVNISARQIEDGKLARQVRGACAAAGVLPASLKLEITESALMGHPDAAAEVLRELRDGGFQLSLDDFGTGYSSLSYLHRFPFHTLKIDRSFVMRLDDGNKEDEIVKVISAMAETLGMDVVAEGIESLGQMRHILRHGVAYGQGYYFSRPLDAESAGRILVSPDRLWPEMKKTA